ncbi:MAG: glucosaminidase domain-containing protein [Cloacibacterium sp.]|nr:glucosaminidase domain-containing protein [Cloacibacterium sp.]
MKKTLSVVLLSVIGIFRAQEWKTDEQYIQKFAKYAVEEMELYKIPASIKLAQGLLETGGGQSRLAQEGKNHFGIKCKEDWTGKTMKHTDDAPNECFRVYDDPRQSYRDHSIFLATRRYYTGLFKLDPKDYKAWAHGLKKAGYATNPRYAQILIGRIEKYKLYEFDNISKNQVNEKLLALFPGYQSDDFIVKTTPKEEEKVVAYTPPPAPKPKPLTKQEILKSLSIQTHPNDGLRYVVIPDKIDLASVAEKYDISERRLMRYNELDSSNLNKNQIVFLESKNSSGNQEFYTAQSGEKMYDIAQKFGMKLHKLYRKNRMQEGQQPTTGQVIYLQNRKPRS